MSEAGVRPAVPSDLQRIFEIRDEVGGDGFTDPAAVTVEAVAWFLQNGPMWVWREGGESIVGFSAGDARKGAVWALFVVPGHRGKGIARELLDAACATLRVAGHSTAKLGTKAGSDAERHLRASGWSEIGAGDKGEVVFQKPL